MASNPKAPDPNNLRTRGNRAVERDNKDSDGPAKQETVFISRKSRFVDFISFF
jgi:hypothetical protein